VIQAPPSGGLSNFVAGPMPPMTPTGRSGRKSRAGEAGASRQLRNAQRGSLPRPLVLQKVPKAAEGAHHVRPGFQPAAPARSPPLWSAPQPRANSLPVTAFKTALPQDNYCVGFSLLLKARHCKAQITLVFLLNNGPWDYACPRPPPDPACAIRFTILLSPGRVAQQRALPPAAQTSPPPDNQSNGPELHKA